MHTVIIATTNAHKVQEIAAKLVALGANNFNFTDLRAYPNYVAPAENGATFAQNAQLKAVAAAQVSGHIALADDSGLCVDALGGAPGVYSARYAGSGHDDAANNAKLLAELKGVPPNKRGAAFFCAIALAHPNGKVLLTEGKVKGHILPEPCGSGGFGYDPLFFVDELNCGMANLTLAQKNLISHRGRALQAALPLLLQLCGY